MVFYVPGKSFMVRLLEMSAFGNGLLSENVSTAINDLIFKCIQQPMALSEIRAVECSVL